MTILVHMTHLIPRLLKEKLDLIIGDGSRMGRRIWLTHSLLIRKNAYTELNVTVWERLKAQTNL